MRPCFGCGKDTTQRCPACGIAPYCSAECLREARGAYMHDVWCVETGVAHRASLLQGVHFSMLLAPQTADLMDKQEATNEDETNAQLAKMIATFKGRRTHHRDIYADVMRHTRLALKKMSYETLEAGILQTKVDEKLALAELMLADVSMNGNNLLFARDDAPSVTLADTPIRSPRTVLLEALDRLQGMSGLIEAKRLAMQLLVRAEQNPMGLATGKRSLTIVGPPGAGKSTFAVIYAKLLYGLGALVTLESDTDLLGGTGKYVARYTGWTVDKTTKRFAELLASAQVIDEAEAFLGGSGDAGDFAKEAMDELTRLADAYAPLTTLVLVGYPAEIRLLVQVNQGIKRRLGTPGELEIWPWSHERIVADMMKQVARLNDSAGLLALTGLSEKRMQEHLTNLMAYEITVPRRKIHGVVYEEGEEDQTIPFGDVLRQRFNADAAKRFAELVDGEGDLLVTEQQVTGHDPGVPERLAVYEKALAAFVAYATDNLIVFSFDNTDYVPEGRPVRAATPFKVWAKARKATRDKAARARELEVQALEANGPPQRGTKARGGRRKKEEEDDDDGDESGDYGPQAVARRAANKLVIQARREANRGNLEAARRNPPPPSSDVMELDDDPPPKRAAKRQRKDDDS